MNERSETIARMYLSISCKTLITIHEHACINLERYRGEGLWIAASGQGWSGIAAGGSGGGKGGGQRGASAPGGTVQGAAFGGAKIWNSDIWPLLANWLHNFIPTQTRAESVSSSFLFGSCN